jgi:hypothetical protein
MINCSIYNASTKYLQKNDKYQMYNSKTGMKLTSELYDWVNKETSIKQCLIITKRLK